MKEYLDFAVEIAKYAGKVMNEYFFNGENIVEYKDDRTPVTYVDKKINNYLIEQVKNKYPEHSVDGEEESYKGNGPFVWVCDPLDGTSMYTRHVPVSVFSLALVVDGEVIIGVVYDPFLDEMYTAIRGEGAYCNNKRIHVNNKKFDELGCTIDYCMWNEAKYDTVDIMKAFRPHVKTSQVGSVAHACMLVARGLISGEVFPGSVHGHCDIAASALIVEEAGGIVTDFHGRKQKYDRPIDGAVLTNVEINKDLLKIIKDTVL